MHPAGYQPFTRTPLPVAQDPCTDEGYEQNPLHDGTVEIAPEKKSERL
jgi:hypothetical protein